MKLVLFGCVAAIIVAGSVHGDRESASVPGGAEIKDFQIVPCLLPSRVRKLGNLVYPERRRLTETTAKQCELRGGEYTFYDRATPESSVAFFQPLAEAGDPVAQVSLGEVYEYLFDEPRYGDAVAWYRKAADQGDTTGLRRLAHLYESGLGVPADTLLATNLWRQAIGTDENLVLASEMAAVRTAADERIATLTAELRARNAESENLRRALAAAEQDIVERRGTLDRARADVASLQRELASVRSQGGADPQRVASLERNLAERTQVIEEQRYRIESMEADLGAQQAQLLASVKRVELENERLQSELGRASQASDEELARARAELTAKSEELERIRAEQAGLVAALDTQRTRFDALVDELDVTRASAGSSREAAVRAAELEAERVRQAQALADSETRVKGLESRLAATQTEADELRSALDTAAHERERVDAELASSEAELVDARRSLVDAESELDGARAALTRAQTEREQLVSSLESATVGGAEVARLQANLKVRDRDIAVAEGRLQEVIAQRDEYKTEVDRLREQRTMQLATRGMIDPLPDTSKVKLPRGVKVGKGYALVIGNNDYASGQWRDLNFARSDAATVHEVLTNRYRFESRLLLDATATQIFSAFAELDAKLNPEDRLVIYYAGHGIQLGRESFWVGVDAPGGRVALETTGVSSDRLNDWLSALQAKHVIVIADSCYTGAGIETTGGMKYTATDVEQTLKFYLGSRSRTLISSGGDEPVPDGDAGEGSVFTKVLVSLLNENQGVLFADDLFEHLTERVRYGRTDASAGVPTPVFARLEMGGHGSGQFVFIRPSVVKS